MHKKTKIFISLILIFIFSILFHISSAKYIIESIYTVAKLDIDRCHPNIELIDINSSNTTYPTYANKTHLISGHIKITEKNIIRNDFSQNNLKITVAHHPITPEFKTFSLLSENADEKIYEFSFTNTTNDGSLVLIIPEGIIEDKSGLRNQQKEFATNICIDNTAPVATFKEINSSHHKSKAQITCNESIHPISGWDIAENNKLLTKEFTNSISYFLPLTDFAQNHSEILVDIKNATNISLQYGTYDAYSKQTLVSGGKITAPKTISSNSICKTEAIYFRLSGSFDSFLLQAKCYLHTHWGDYARGICQHSKLFYLHGYNPTSPSEWIDSTNKKPSYYFKQSFIQLGGTGLNIPKATASNKKIAIPNVIAKQYLYGISGIQFRLKNTPDFSIVYQSYVNEIGWLKASSDGEENLYQHKKPISAFRMNLVPKTEKQYFLDSWNRDVSTNHTN